MSVDMSAPSAAGDVLTLKRCLGCPKAGDGLTQYTCLLEEILVPVQRRTKWWCSRCRALNSALKAARDAAAMVIVPGDAAAGAAPEPPSPRRAPPLVLLPTPGLAPQQAFFMEVAGRAVNGVPTATVSASGQPITLVPVAVDAPNLLSIARIFRAPSLFHVFLPPQLLHDAIRSSDAAQVNLALRMQQASLFTNNNVMYAPQVMFRALNNFTMSPELLALHDRFQIVNQSGLPDKGVAADDVYEQGFCNLHGTSDNGDRAENRAMTAVSLAGDTATLIQDATGLGVVRKQRARVLRETEVEELEVGAFVAGFFAANPANQHASRILMPNGGQVSVEGASVFENGCARVLQCARRFIADFAKPGFNPCRGNDGLFKHVLLRQSDVDKATAERAEKAAIAKKRRLASVYETAAAAAAAQ